MVFRTHGPSLSFSSSSSSLSFSFFQLYPRLSRSLSLSLSSSSSLYSSSLTISPWNTHHSVYHSLIHSHFVFCQIDRLLLLLVQHTPASKITLLETHCLLYFHHTLFNPWSIVHNNILFDLKLKGDKITRILTVFQSSTIHRLYGNSTYMLIVVMSTVYMKSEYVVHIYSTWHTHTHRHTQQLKNIKILNFWPLLMFTQRKGSCIYNTRTLQFQCAFQNPRSRQISLFLISLTYVNISLTYKYICTCTMPYIIYVNTRQEMIERERET